MADYIKREDAIAAFSNPCIEHDYGRVCEDAVIDLINAIPAADVRENVRGEWLTLDSCKITIMRKKNKIMTNILPDSLCHFGFFFVNLPNQSFT